MIRYIKKNAGSILFISIMVILLFGTLQKFTQEDDCECPTTWDYLVNLYSPEVTTGEPEESSWYGNPLDYIYPPEETTEVTTGEPEESSWYGNPLDYIYPSEETTEEYEPQPFEQSSFI